MTKIVFGWRRLLSLATCFVLLSLSGTAFASQLLQPPSQDKFINGWGYNYGSIERELAVFGSYGGVSNGYPILRFDLSGLPADLPLSTEATLEMTEFGAFGATHKYRAHIYSVSESWDADNANWTMRNQTEAWAVSGGSLDFSKDWAATEFTSTGEVSVSQTIRWSLTDLVTAWRSGAIQNNGFAVFPELLALHSSGSETNNYGNLALSGSEAGMRPRLILGSLTDPDYVIQPLLAPVPEPASISMMLAGLVVLLRASNTRKSLTICE